MRNVLSQGSGRRRRKRSQGVVLAAMGMTSFVLTACTEEEPERLTSIEFSEGHAYQSVDDCIAADVFTRTACEQAFEAALNEVPRFESLEACETEFGEGACEVPPAQVAEPTPAGGNWFMPALMGYMIGNALSGTNRGRAIQQVYQEPIYRDRTNRGNWNAAVSGANSRAMTRETSLQRSVTQRNQAATQRGGFGTRTATRGGWGS